MLLARDDEDLRQTLTGRLLREGMRVIEVEDGVELRDCLELRRPGGERCGPRGDVAERDGVVADEAIARVQPLAAPLVLIASLASPALRENAARAGVWAIFEKPFEVEHLISAIRRIATR